ncbi:hypothetical protein [Cetobacterium sp.]|uniref:hypothetical protein n=1 Tax=Cetobacterium sp. TaxID=2071632 RepID=UPI003F2CE33A
MAEELLVDKNGKKIFTFSVSDARERGSTDGEVDIIIRSGSKESFEIAEYIDNVGRKTYTNISAVSWHGFYKEINNDTIMPLIRFKRKEETEIELDHLRHPIAIGRNTPYFTMICSLYIPETKKFENCKNITSNDKKKKQIIEVGQETTRLDFFILPSYMDVNRFMNTAVGLLYYFGDITAFDPNKNGEFKPIMTKDLKYKTCKLGKWYVLVKEIIEENMKSREPKLSSNYSLLLHYPNQFEYIFNRSFAYPNTTPISLGEKFTEDYYGFSLRRSFKTPAAQHQKEINGDIYPYLLIGAYKKTK